MSNPKPAGGPLPTELTDQPKGTALVPLGIVTVCCGTHRAVGCCDPDDCGPCCPECPTCPVVDQWPADERRRQARANREYMLDIRSIHRATARAIDLLPRFGTVHDQVASDIAAAPRPAGAR